MRHSIRCSSACGLVFLTLAAAACGKKANTYVPPPPPEVTVASPVVRQIEDALELTGKTRADATVEVRARVKGFIAKRHVEGGQKVKAGELLYTIDPRTFEAMALQAEATLNARKAELALANATIERVAEALKSNAVAQQDVDRAVAERDVAVSQVALAEATLTNAKLDLEFTEVRSPIEGRMDLWTLDVGQLVGANEDTLLARVTSDAKVYAMFAVDERELLEARAGTSNRRPGEGGSVDMPILIGLASEEGYPHSGVYHGSDSGVDPTSGTMMVEAEFDNSDGKLLPGLFVRVRVPLKKREAMLAPDIAVATDQRGKYVLIVNDKGVVERRDVVPGRLIGRERVIESGLEPGARIVVNGIQRARPGATVVPKPEAPPTPAPTPPSAPAGAGG